jgi:hypothetical protein
MAGTVVGCTNLDSVRIEVLGDGRAITIPASLLLAADRVFRNLGMDTNAMLSVYVDQSPDDGPRQWHAFLHGKVGRSITPWGAIKELADKIEGNG